MTEAQKIATLRSGERGLAARQVLVAAEARLEAAQRELEAPVGAEELHAALGAAQVGAGRCALKGCLLPLVPHLLLSTAPPLLPPSPPGPAQ